MALSKATMKSTIVSKMTTYMGSAEDDTKRQNFAEAMADAILDILKNQMTITVSGATTTGPAGGPLPIVNQPGTVT